MIIFYCVISFTTLYFINNSSSIACPSCEKEELTIGILVRTSPVIAIVRKTNKKTDVSNFVGGGGDTIFEILEVPKGNLKEKYVRVPGFFPLAFNEKGLVFFETPPILLGFYRDKNGEVRKYLLEILALRKETVTTEALKHAIRNLKHPNEIIHEDAFKYVWGANIQRLKGVLEKVPLMRNF